MQFPRKSKKEASSETSRKAGEELLARDGIGCRNTAVVHGGTDRHAAARIFRVKQAGEGDFARGIQTGNRLVVGIQHVCVGVDLETAEGDGGAWRHVEGVVGFALDRNHVLGGLAEVLILTLFAKLVVAGHGRFQRGSVHADLFGQFGDGRGMRYVLHRHAPGQHRVRLDARAVLDGGDVIAAGALRIGQRLRDVGLVAPLVDDALALVGHDQAGTPR